MFNDKPPGPSLLDQKFDLIEMQKQAKKCPDPKSLYYLWDNVCQLKERHLITLNEWEEMREVVFPTLKNLCNLK